MLRTKVLKIDPEHPEREKIALAANAIKNGALVAFPTETVYGLGANALNSRAVKRIFEVKGRPMDNPIIVHVASMEQLKTLAREVPKAVEKLAKKFWPGALTMVLKKRKNVPDVTTACLDTVAIRMPDNSVALALIREAGVPIAAPSANLAGKPSPTKAEHVVKDLYGKVEIIIDGGPVNIGVESTVVDLTRKPPTLLRPGGIDAEEIEKVLGKLEIHPSVRKKIEANAPVPSPGMKYRHYAPEASMLIVEGKNGQVVKKIRELAIGYKKKGKKVGIMTTYENKGRYGNVADVVKAVGTKKDLRSVAKNLFSTLREFDEEGVDVIIAEGFEERGIGLAVMNRLRKASGYNVIRAVEEK